MTDLPEARNAQMARRIEGAPVAYPVRFVVAGDSGAWPDATARGIFSRLLDQVAMLAPPPVFFANLGDFAGPGSEEAHREYLAAVAILPVPDICVVGNHDLDDPGGRANFERIHGPTCFSFAHGDTRFVAIEAQPGIDGQVEVPASPLGPEGPRDEHLAFLNRALDEAAERNRIVLMHMSPHLDGRYAPHEDWGFRRREEEFLEVLRRHRVSLVCCAHGLAFDTHVRDGIRFVMSGGGGTGVCSHFRGVCAEGEAHPEDRGALFHAVEISIAKDGEVSGRVLQAFAGPDEPPRMTFGPAPRRPFPD